MINKELELATLIGEMVHESERALSKGNIQYARTCRIQANIWIEELRGYILAKRTNKVNLSKVINFNSYYINKEANTNNLSEAV